MLFLLCRRALRNSERCIEYVTVPAVLWLQPARPLSRARAHPAFRTSAGGSLVSKRRLDPCCAPFSSRAAPPQGQIQPLAAGQGFGDLRWCHSPHRCPLFGAEAPLGKGAPLPAQKGADKGFCNQGARRVRRF